MTPFQRLLLFGGLGVAVTILGSMLLVVLIPKDFLKSMKSKPKRAGAKKHLLKTLARNAIGWILIVAGVILSLPGVPGPGILIILLGLFLVDFPGKATLQRKILSSGKITGPANRLRRLFHRAPLELPES